MNTMFNSQRAPVVETHKIADNIITEPNLDFVKELIKTTRQLKCRKRAVNNNSE